MWKHWIPFSCIASLFCETIATAKYVPATTLVMDVDGDMAHLSARTIYVPEETMVDGQHFGLTPFSLENKDPTSRLGLLPVNVQRGTRYDHVTPETLKGIRSLLGWSVQSSPVTTTSTQLSVDTRVQEVSDLSTLQPETPLLLDPTENGSAPLSSRALDFSPTQTQRSFFQDAFQAMLSATHQHVASQFERRIQSLEDQLQEALKSQSQESSSSSSEAFSRLEEKLATAHQRINELEQKVQVDEGTSSSQTNQPDVMAQLQTLLRPLEDRIQALQSTSEHTVPTAPDPQETSLSLITSQLSSLQSVQSQNTETLERIPQMEETLRRLQETQADVSQAPAPVQQEPLDLTDQFQNALAPITHQVQTLQENIARILHTIEPITTHAQALPQLAALQLAHTRSSEILEELHQREVQGLIMQASRSVHPSEIAITQPLTDLLRPLQDQVRTLEILFSDVSSSLGTNTQRLTEMHTQLAALQAAPSSSTETSPFSSSTPHPADSLLRDLAEKSDNHQTMLERLRDQMTTIMIAGQEVLDRLRSPSSLLSEDQDASPSSMPTQGTTPKSSLALYVSESTPSQDGDDSSKVPDPSLYETNHPVVTPTADDQDTFLGGPTPTSQSEPHPQGTMTVDEALEFIQSISTKGEQSQDVSYLNEARASFQKEGGDPTTIRVQLLPPSTPTHDTKDDNSDENDKLPQRLFRIRILFPDRARLQEELSTIRSSTKGKPFPLRSEPPVPTHSVTRSPNVAQPSRVVSQAISVTTPGKTDPLTTSTSQTQRSVKSDLSHEDKDKNQSLSSSGSMPLSRAQETLRFSGENFSVEKKVGHPELGQAIQLRLKIQSHKTGQDPIWKEFTAPYTLEGLCNKEPLKFEAPGEPPILIERRYTKLFNEERKDLDSYTLDLKATMEVRLLNQSLQNKSLARISVPNLTQSI